MNLILTVTKTYLLCAHCGQSTGHTVDHLLAEDSDWKRESFGPWNCESCGWETVGYIKDGKVVKTEKVDQRVLPTLDLLMLPPQTSPVYFAVKGMAFCNTEAEIPNKDPTFFYESHSCPTNWLRDLQLLSIEGDHDPHGLLKFVSRQPFPTENPRLSDTDWSEVYPYLGVKDDPQND